MFAFIEGRVCEKGNGSLVIQAGGIGFLVTCSLSTIQAAPPVGENMRCLTYFSVREDAMELYGFATQEEKELFLRLIGVSGVGAKSALSLLGTLSPHDLTTAIVLEDITSISRAPGIGKKTAQRIVLELHDKVAPGGVIPAAAPAGSTAPPPADSVGEAIEALMALGYSAVEVRSVLGQIRDPGSKRADELVTLALRSMATL